MSAPSLHLTEREASEHHAASLDGDARSPFWARVMAAIAVLGSIAAVGAFAFVALSRFRSPAELEWLEGGMLDEVRRVAGGRQLYTTPSIQWTPYMYAPLYVWVSAAAGKLFGVRLVVLRTVSIVSAAVAGAMVWALTKYETHDRVAATVSVGLLYATYRLGGAWLDLARVDTLALALALAGLLLVRIAKTAEVLAVGALLLVAACLTKQSMLLPALAVVPWTVVRGRRAASVFATTFGTASVVSVLALQVSTHGWFSYYLWTVPSHHTIYTPALIGFWTHDLLRPLFLALLLVAVAFTWMAHSTSRANEVWFYGPVFAALLLASYTARLHSGGYDNVLLEAYAGVATMAGIGFAVLRRTTTPAWAGGVGAALIVLQLGVLHYSPTQQLPARSSAGDYRRLVSEISSLPRPVYLPGQPWLLTAAGDRGDMSAQSAALEDVLRAHTGAVTTRLANDMENAIRTRRYCTVIVDRPALYSTLPNDFARYYKPAQLLLHRGELEPVTGTQVVPWQVWTPRGVSGCGEPSARSG